MYSASKAERNKGANFDTSCPNPPPHPVKDQIPHPLGGFSCQNVLLPMSVVGGEGEGGGEEGEGRGEGRGRKLKV